jgi:hypothetical protein
MLAWTVRTIQAVSIAAITTSAMPTAISMDRSLLSAAESGHPLRLGDMMRVRDNVVAIVLLTGR